MISTLPSPCWEILMVSPRLPTRPSTLIFSFRNFSKAETSKILSLAGCEALMTNCTGRVSDELHEESRGRLTDLLGHLGALGLGASLLLNTHMNLSLLFYAMIAQATCAEGLGQQQSGGVIYILRWEPFLRLGE